MTSKVSCVFLAQAILIQVAFSQYMSRNAPALATPCSASIAASTLSSPFFETSYLQKYPALASSAIEVENVLSQCVGSYGTEVTNNAAFGYGSGPAAIPSGAISSNLGRGSSGFGFTSGFGGQGSFSNAGSLGYDATSGAAYGGNGEGNVIVNICGQCVGIPGVAEEFAVAGNGLAYGPGLGAFGAPALSYPGAPYGAYAGLNAAPTSGGGFAVTSVSPITPTGISVVSENAIEGAVSIVGELPFLGAVAVEGALPTAGAGGINYGCGNGAVGIVSEGVAPPVAPNAYPGNVGFGAAGFNGGLPYGAGLGGLGYGARPGCGLGGMGAVY
ncbi:unnamed protein product [Arctia plantaginis]|uniref:Uncharacterized protein n=1 Tax=Arctia plantaginis TaxID=874455 RepID=A0A8S1BH18_ARCPL|nr:unnamed protein product [Arctia plantaginis]